MLQQNPEWLNEPPTPNPGLALCSPRGRTAANGGHLRRSLSPSAPRNVQDDLVHPTGLKPLVHRLGKDRCRCRLGSAAGGPLVLRHAPPRMVGPSLPLVGPTFQWLWVRHTVYICQRRPETAPRNVPKLNRILSCLGRMPGGVYYQTIGSQTGNPEEKGETCS